MNFFFSLFCEYASVSLSIYFFVAVTAESKVLLSLQYNITLHTFQTHQNSTPELKTKIRFFLLSFLSFPVAFEDKLNQNYPSQLNLYVMHKFMYIVFVLHVFQN